MSCIRGHYLLTIESYMKEVKNTSSLVLEVINPETGDTFRTKGSSEEVTKYYSIRRITSRVNAMDLLTILSKICKSPKDLVVINKLLDMANAESHIVLVNITAKAKDLTVARSKLNKLLATSVEQNFFYKIDKGTYMVNPYIFIGKRVRSNEIREELQTTWKSLTNNLTYLRE